MLDIRLLSGFLAIAEAGSITRAAESLHITQPALSRQLAQLESDVGARLVMRGKKGIELTHEGRALRRRAREIVDLAALAESEVSGRGAELEGRLAIGAGELSSMAFVLHVVNEFCSEHRLVAFEQFTGVADQVAERLDRGLLDFGVLLEPAGIEQFDCIPLPGGERWIALVRSDDPLAEAGEVQPNDLRGRDLIVPSRLGADGQAARWLGIPAAAVRVRATINLGNNGFAMVQEGMGVLLCVEGSAAFADPSLFARLPIAGVELSRTVLAWKRGVPPTRIAQAFIDRMWMKAAGKPEAIP